MTKTRGAMFKKQTNSKYDMRYLILTIEELKKKIKELEDRNNFLFLELKAHDYEEEE